MTSGVHHLVLGGARSGKSRFAEQIVLAQSDKSPVYLATAEAGDEEMRQRILHHQSQRSNQWSLIEEPLDIAAHILQFTAAHCVLIDCLTLWLSNCLHRQQWQQQKDAFLQALHGCPAEIVMVSNEVGSGIIPQGELSRQFVDEIGWLHQTLAQHCQQVSLIVAGLPTQLK